MRKSRQEAAKTRERIIASAAAEFREHGITATGDQEKTGAIPTSHRMSPASLVAEATTSRAIPRSKHGLDLAEETGSAVVTWTKTKYRYPLSPRFFPVSRKRTALTAILTLEAD